MKVSCEVNSIDLTVALAKAGRCEKQVTSMVTIAAREDTKPYVPYETGALRSSAETESVPDQGRLVWGNADVRYARRQYYDPKLANKRWPGTTMQWFDVSKAANLSRWIRVADAAVKEVCNGV